MTDNKKGQNLTEKTIHEKISAVRAPKLTIMTIVANIKDMMLLVMEKRNVKFYKRLGFKVVDECHVNIGKGYVNWTMVREPKAK